MTGSIKLFQYRSEDVDGATVSDSATAITTQGLNPAETKLVLADVPNSASASAPRGLMPVEKNEIDTIMHDSVTVSAPQGSTYLESRQTEAVMANSMPKSAPEVFTHTDRKDTGTDLSQSPTAFAPRGFSPVGTIRLDGKNYHCWGHIMEFFLKQLKIAYVLSVPCPSISPSQEASIEEISQAKFAAQKWIDDDCVCHHHILNSLCDHLFDQYSKKNCSAKEIWEELKLAYDEDFGTKRSQVNKYVQFQMVEGISILEQVEELHKIANSIIASGMWIDENFHVSAIISKLPPSWKECRVKLMRLEFLPVDLLMYYLKVEEESRSSCRKEEAPRNGHVGKSKFENNLGPRKKEMKRVCYNCGKEGHISKNCNLKKLERSIERDDEVVPVINKGNIVETTDS